MTFVEALIDGATDGTGETIDGLDRVEALAISPDGAHVYAGSFSDKAAAVFERDAATGELTFVQALFDGEGGVDGLSETSSVTISPDGGHVYAAGRGDSAVAVFSRDDTTGELTFVEIQKDGVGGVDGIDGARIDFPNGWALARASNTQPQLTFRFEGDTEKDLEEIKEKVGKILDKYNIRLD